MTRNAIPKNSLLDYLVKANGLKNDAALCRSLKVLPPQISKIRHGVQVVGSTMILKMHEAFNVPVAKIRMLIALDEKC